MFRTIYILLVGVALLFAQNETESNDFSYPLKLYNQQFYDLAAQQFVKFYSNYPNSAKADQAHYFTAMSYLQLKDYAKARAEFQTLAVGFPKSDKAAEAWFQTGRCSYLLSEPEEAAKSYETVRLLYPQHALAAEGLYEAAVILLDLQQYNRAYQNLMVLVDRYAATSFYAPAVVKAALALYYQEENDRALQMVLRALNLQTDDAVLAEANLIAARIHFKLGNREQSVQFLDAVLSSYPSTVSRSQAALLRAQVYVDSKKYGLARQILQAELTTHKNEQARIPLADIAFISGNYNEAFDLYDQQQVAAKDTNFLAIQLKKALCLRRLGRKEAARDLLNTSLQLNDVPRNRFYQAADSVYLNWLETDEQIQPIISRLNAALLHTAVGKHQFGLKVRLAANLAKNKNWIDVIHLLQPLTLTQESFAKKDALFYLLARAYDQSEAYDDAVFYYRKLITDFPASEHYDFSVSRMEYLTRYKIVNKQVVLEKLADIVADNISGSNNIDLQVAQGLMYLEDMKRFDKAEQQFLKALKDSSKQAADIHHYLGKTYMRMAEASGNDKMKVRAVEQFKLALASREKLSKPDEASWLLVELNLNADTTSLGRQIRILERLLDTYPQSRLRETWMRNLAFRTALDTTYQKENLRYFKALVEEYRESADFADYLFGYAEALRLSNEETAIQQYKLLASELPYTHPAAKALFEVAVYYEARQMYPEARQLYELVLQRYGYTPQAAEVSNRLGPLLVRAGAYEQALPYLQANLQHPFMKDDVLGQAFLGGDTYEQLYFYGLTQEHLQRSRQAISAYRTYLKRQPDGRYIAAARFNLGSLYYGEHRYVPATRQFEQVASGVTPQANQARLYLAQIAFEAGDYQNAAVRYKAVVTGDFSAERKKEIVARYTVSLIRAADVKAGKNAIASYKKQFPDDRDNAARFILELAEFQRINKNFKNASRLLAEVQKKYKKTAWADDAEYTQALIFITQNKIEDAFKILTGFYTKYPQSDRLAAALNTLGSLYFRTEKYDNAMSMFKNALKGRPERELEANIKSNLIKTYTMTSFWDAAQALAREYVKDFPDRSDIMDKKITIAQAYINLNQFQNAVDYLKKIKLEADSEREPEIQFYIGEALLKGGQYENAIAEFVKIPLLSKKTKLQWEASALYYSGQSYEKLGRMADAKRMYQEIIQRPGIDLILKKEAQKRIQQIQ